MNAERLHRVARLILDELSEAETPETVEKLRSGLESLTRTPGDAQAQQMIADARTHLHQTMRTAPSNSWPPSDRQIFDEIGISDMVGQRLLNRIEEILARNQMTPSVAHDEIDPLSTRLGEVVQQLNALVPAFAFFKIGRDDVVEEYEVAIDIPRREVGDSSLPQLGKEFAEWQKILAPFEELAGVGVADFQVRAISSSDFGLFLAAVPGVAFFIVKGVNYVLDAYQKLLNIKRMRSEMAAEVPEEKLSDVDEFVNALMTEELTKAATELIAQSKELDEGRRNEMQVAVKISLNKIANRIDAGYSIDIRTPPLPAEPQLEEEGGEGGQAALEAYNQALEIQQLAERVKRLESSGSRILELPEGESENDYSPE